MENRILISMVDYVLDFEHRPNYEMNHNKIINYAKFLSMPLTLGMFVPCDEYDQPMTEHLQYDDRLCDFCPLEKKGVYSVPGGSVAGCEGSRCDVAGENYQDAYKEALGNVIFEGFETKVDDFGDLVFYRDKKEYAVFEFPEVFGNQTIQDLLLDNKYVDLILTQSAITKYQI